MLLLLTASPAFAADAVQTPGQLPGGTQIPLDNSATVEPKEDNSDEQYALLVIGAALLPIVLFAGYKIMQNSNTATQKSRYRYSAGPADARSVRRRKNQPRPKRSK